MYLSIKFIKLINNFSYIFYGNDQKAIYSTVYKNDKEKETDKKLYNNFVAIYSCNNDKYLDMRK